MPTFDFPSVEEELNRKTLDALEWLMRSREQGKIDGSQYSTAIHALFIATAGILPRDINDILMQANTDAKGERHIDCRVFVRPGVRADIAVVKRLVGGSKVSVKRGLDAGTWRDKMLKKYDDPSEATDVFNRAIEMLVSNGYKSA